MKIKVLPLAVCTVLASCQGSTEQGGHLQAITRGFEKPVEFLPARSRIMDTMNPRPQDAKKRGFHNFDGDAEGIQDLIEIHDMPTLNQILRGNFTNPITQFNARIYPGSFAERDNGEKEIQWTDAAHNGRVIPVPLKLQAIIVETLEQMLKHRIASLPGVARRLPGAGQALDWLRHHFDIRAHIKNTGLKFDTAELNGDGRADVVISTYAYIDWSVETDNSIISMALSLLGEYLRVGSFIFVGSTNGSDYDFQALDTTFKMFREDKGLGEAMLDAFIRDRSDHDVVKRWLSGFYLDWADVDRDGLDDFVVLKKVGNNLQATTFVNKTRAGDSTIHFDFDRRKHETTIGNFMVGSWIGVRTIDEVDMADIDGDGYYDIVIYDEYELPMLGGFNMNNSMRFRVARNTWAETGRLSYVAHGDHEVDEIETACHTPLACGMVFPGNTRFKKRDFFDVNGDGCDDYTHAGIADSFDNKISLDAKMALNYNLSVCSR